MKNGDVLFHRSAWQNKGKRRPVSCFTFGAATSAVAGDNVFYIGESDADTIEVAGSVKEHRWIKFGVSQSVSGNE
jgi:hypothetical protein